MSGLLQGRNAALAHGAVQTGYIVTSRVSQLHPNRCQLRHCVGLSVPPWNVFTRKKKHTLHRISAARLWNGSFSG